MAAGRGTQRITRERVNTHRGLLKEDCQSITANRRTLKVVWAERGKVIAQAGRQLGEGGRQERHTPARGP